MLGNVKRLFSATARQEQLQQRLDELRHKLPVPVFWLLGKTQSGKTSVVKYLTGADEAEIGRGFQPCTRFSRLYHFPTPDAPLLTFLDTRGLEEPGYEPAEDLARFDAQAHVLLVTVKVMDHAQEKVLEHLRAIRAARPSRPVLLLLTCLHEAYPQQQHPPWAAVAGHESGGRAQEESQKSGVRGPAGQESGCHQGSGANGQESGPEGGGSVDLRPLFRSIQEQVRRFDGLVDHVLPIDLTRPEEGFAEPDYGGAPLRQKLLEVLPAAYRQTLLTLDEATRQLQDLYAQQALPHIVAYSVLSATAGAFPIPFLDLLVLPGIQTQMIYHLARFYGQPLSGTRFLELAGTLGLGMITRQAVRELTKFIPYVGSVASAALAGASTFALGKAFCYYYSAVHKGQVPQAEDLRRYYQDQLRQAEEAWKRLGRPA
jgi:uncharacterized protein (DUF697 family)